MATPHNCTFGGYFSPGALAELCGAAFALLFYYYSTAAATMQTFVFVHGTSDEIPCGGWRIFFANPSVRKAWSIAQPLAASPPYGCGIPLAGTQSTPALSKPCLDKKSLAIRSC